MYWTTRCLHGHHGSNVSVRLRDQGQTMPVFKYKLSHLGLEKRVTYKRGRWKDVERAKKYVTGRLQKELNKNGQAAAQRLWDESLAELLARSGGARRRGENLTQAQRRKGWKNRGKQLKKDKAHQRDAQLAQALSKRVRVPLSAQKATNKTRKALRNGSEVELSLFEGYLAERQSKRPRVDWTDRQPKTETEVQHYLLDNYHFCHNFREDDPTSQKFKTALAQVTDGFTLFCCALVHAVLPNWTWYSVMVPVACRSLVFDPTKLVSSSVNKLTDKLTAALDQWEKKNDPAPFWSPMPYITLALADDSKPRQLAKLMVTLQQKGRKLYDDLVQASASAGASGLTTAVRQSISDATLVSMVKDRALNGFSWFTAYQALVSFAGVQQQANVFLYDPDNHAVTGNGANSALQRFYPGLPISGYGKAARKAQLAGLQHLHKRVAGKAKVLFGRKARQWRLQAAEHTPCEYFKYRMGMIFFAGFFRVRLRSPVGETGKKPRRMRRSRA